MTKGWCRFSIGVGLALMFVPSFTPLEIRPWVVILGGAFIIYGFYVLRTIGSVASLPQDEDHKSPPLKSARTYTVRPKPSDFNLTEQRIQEIETIISSRPGPQSAKYLWPCVFIVWSIILIWGFGESTNFNFTEWSKLSFAGIIGGIILTFLAPSIFVLVGIWIILGPIFERLETLEDSAWTRKKITRYKDYYDFLDAQKKYEAWVLRTKWAFWDRLDGRSFEEEVASLLRKSGYSVKLTPASGDGGVDIVLGDGTIVQ